MPIESAADLAAMLADFGEPVTFGSAAVNGIPDETDEAALAANETESIGVMRVVVIPTGGLPGLANGSTVTFRGATCTVRRMLRIDDGALTQLVLGNG